MRRALVVVLALVACDSTAPGPEWRAAGNARPRDGGTLRFAINGQIATLDPTIGYDDYSGYGLHPLFDTLLGYDPSSPSDPAKGLALVPHLAESWEVSADGLTYTFQLRPGLQYADGTPIVAADFAYSLERAISTADSPFGPMLADVVGAAELRAGTARHATGITAVDARTLRLQLGQRGVALPYVLTMAFSTPQRSDHVAAAGTALRRELLANGPFMFEQWDEGRRLRLRKNPKYWAAESIHLDAIEVLENVPRDTAYLMFQRGELDSCDKLAAPDYIALRANPLWQGFVFQRAIMNAYGARMNVRVKPFDDRRVRQALNYAVDKEHLVKLLHGAAVASHGLLSPGMFGRDDQLAPYPHDPAKARALLAEAGYAGGLELEFLTQDDFEAETIAESIQGDLAEIGVRVRITKLEWATYTTLIGAANGPPFSLATWTGDYPDPTDFFDAVFHSRMIADDNSNNSSFYSNPELDALLDRARGETDPATRAAMYRRAERILYDDAPWIWGYHQMLTEVVQPYVKGYAPHPVWLRDFTTAWLDLGADGERVKR